MKTEILYEERSRAQWALQQSDERYKRLLHATTDYIYSVDVENGRSGMTRHGPGCESVTGYAPQEFAADPTLWYRIVHEEDRPAVVVQIKEVLENRVPPPLEHRIITKRGETRWIQNTPIPRRDGEGRLIGYDGLIKNITRHKRAEERLETEHRLLRTLIDNVPDCIFVKDVNSRFVLNNAAHLKVMGAHTQEEASGKDDFDYFPKELAAQYRADEESVLKCGEALRNREEPVLDSGGRHLWFTTTKVPLRNLRGEVVGLAGIAHDITERRLAEEALRESQERLALVIQGSNDGIWDWNILTGECFFSPRWKSMLGYEEHELANAASTWEGLLHPEDRPNAMALLQDYLSGRVPKYELEARLRQKDGSYRWILARGAVLRNAEGKPVRMLGTQVDLSERKQAAERLQAAYVRLADHGTALRKIVRKLRASHRELKATQLQLIQSAKLESLGTLAAGVAHDVKNPLQTIIMGVDYLSRKLPHCGEEAAHTLLDMREAVKRANAIVLELLALSASTPFEKTPEDLNQLLERSLSLVNAQLSKSRSRVHREYAVDVPPVPADRTKLEQVFINLILNALQAMGENGILTLRTRVTVAGSGRSLLPRHFRARSNQVVAVAEVEDTGPGIPEEVLPRVFDPFFTTKPVGVGTGLGLSVAKKIVDLHGGAIELFNSERGVIARVALKL